MSAGAAAAAAALMASGFANARKFQVDREKQKLKRKLRQDELKVKYSKRFSEEEQLFIETLNLKTANPNLPLSSKSCPECNSKFSLVELSEIEIDCCLKCNSFWFDSGELMEFHGLESDAPSDNLKSRKSKYSCPVCTQEMREVVFKAPHNLLVDQCTEHGVYLENKELHRVVELS
jgi:Zn-finger nucleic acid-binding protein